ncbi:MAG: zinc-ribbon domain-containing protein, partial [Syntrophaceae bacterium]|nr:zinc-ribbon domain-containing protein [Syntrophaceae bacterium]
MIIECKKCGTKYRFDESQIEGDGVWVRCTRCEVTFFQESPLAEPPPPVEALEPEREGQGAAAVEGDGMPEGVESAAPGLGPTWEDTYRDPGEGITIVSADEIEGKGTFPGDITIEDGGTGPAVEDVFREPREEIPFEGLQKEIPEEDEPAPGGLKAEDLDTEIRGSDVFRE